MGIYRPGGDFLRMLRRKEKELRVLAIASAGGHWIQLQRLRPAWEGMDVAYASIYPEYGDDLAGQRYYTFPDFNRFAKIKIFELVFKIFLMLLRERPDVIITTGSAPALITLFIGKYIFRSRTIWIDSVANCEQLSSSGQRAGRIADVWLTQWQHLARPEGPQFLGSVL